MAQEGKVLGQDAHIGQVTIRSTDAQVGANLAVARFFLSNLLFSTLYGTNKIGRFC